MNAYIIYEKEEGEKNRGFIELFQKEGNLYGISFLFISKEDYKKKELPFLVLNRTRDVTVSEFYENRKVHVLHGSTVVECGNDKWKTYQFLKKRMKTNPLFFPKTVFLPKLTMQKLIDEVQSYHWQKNDELVLKTTGGHGGQEVFLLPRQKITENSSFFNKMNLSLLLNKDCILQEKIPGPAMDVRVYIVGNQIYHAILREGKNDFRSNYSLGGAATSYTLSKEEKSVVRQYLDVFSGMTLGLCGLDFIISEDGRFIFNELEEMVGCRMLYAKSEKDIVKDYVKWIVDKISKMDSE